MEKFTKLMLSFALLIIAGGNLNAQNNITVTMAGNGTATYTGDGSTGLYAGINGPTDVCVDAAGNIYFADNGNSRIRKVAAATGVISTLASGINPYYMCMDASGNLYFSTTGAIKKINLSSGIITTVAGTGTAGYSGDGGPATAAMIRGQLGICLDTYGNLYIADGTNNRVREVSAATGIITTIAGTGISGYMGDDSDARSAELGVPLFVCVNASGDVYIADQGEGYTSGIISYVSSNAMVIRKISGSTGIITTFAGSISGSNPAGLLAIDALLGSITGMCLDAEGNIYCNETSCSCRKISVTTDSINYVGGDFYDDDFIDNINSLGAWMDEPHGLFVDAQNNIYVADYINSRIRKLIQLSHTPSFAYGIGQSITLCAGYTTSIDTQMAITNLDLHQSETWTVLNPPVNGTLSGFPYSRLAKGYDSLTTVSGLSYTPAAGFTGADSFNVQVSNGTLSSVITIYVSVVAPPNPGVISGPTNVCIGTGSVHFSDGVSGGTWSATASTIASVNLIGSVTGVSAGLDTLIYTVTAACASNTTYAINVTPLPDAGTITGSTGICLGATTTLGDAVTGGVWSAGTSGYATVIGEGASGAIVTGITAGTDIITYSYTNACGTATTTLTVNVESLPDPGTISGSAGVCIGSGITLTPTIAGGTWVTSNTNATVDATGFVTGSIAGVDSIIYTITSATTGCTANTADLVTIVATPDPGVISGPTSVCAGSSITLDESASGGAWSNVNPDASISGGILTGISQGIDTIVYSVSNAYCNAATLFQVVINAAPNAGTITGLDNVYTGTSTALSNTATGGIWTTSNTSISTVSATGLAYGIAPGIDSIIYTFTNTCGTANTYFTFEVLADTVSGINNIIAGINKLSIIPNPAKENFIISVSSTFNEPATITITNMIGEKLKEITGNTNQPIDASLNAPAGIYLLNASTPHGNMGSKIVIE